MKFGTTLRNAVYEPWRESYIDYAKLKKLLREDDSSRKDDAWTDEDAQAFYAELVNSQLEKVTAFHKSTYQKLRDRTAKCESKLDPVAKAVQDNDSPANDNPPSSYAAAAKKPAPSEGERKRILKEVIEELDKITKDINELEKYSRINYTGFLKIAKKHDRKRGGRVSSIRPLVKSRMADVPFNNEDYSPLLYRLSAMYSFARQNLEGQDRPLSLVESIAAEESYTTHKFWVHMDNLLEVKTVILRRLPVLVYNPQTEKVADGSQQDPSITSIYFDNPDFNLYSNKVEHKTDASNLRLRWYGKLSQKPEIMLEKKTVKTENTSADERFPIKDKYIQPFIKGQYHMEKAIEKRSSRYGEEALESFKKGVNDIQSFIKDHDLQPVLRANYTRTAFQIPGDDRVRISIDTNLAFIREDAIDPERPCRDPEDWHRRDIDDAEMEWPFKSVRKGELATFPHAVLEIKVKNDKHYEWIDDLMNSHLVKEAAKFSKFVHGVASLFEDNVNTFPFWLSTLEEDIRQDPEVAFEKEQAKKQKQQEDEMAVGSLMKSKSHSSYKPGAISPVGSPTDKTGSYLDRRASRQSAMKTGGQSLGSVARSQPTGMAAVADEPDSDDDGRQAHNTEIPEATTQSGLQTLFPSFSTSKYARNRRDRDMPLPPGVQKPEYWIKDQGPVKVEAKVWLANQRTFIKWQHITVLLASLSLGLFNAAGENNNIARALALVYTLAAVFTGVWGWGVYQWRSRLIEQRSGKDFDALTGPVVVCVGLFVALILNFVFKYEEMKKNAGGHHGHHHSNQTHSVFGGMDELK